MFPRSIIVIEVGEQGGLSTITVDGKRYLSYKEWNAEAWRARSNAAHNLTHVLDSVQIAEMEKERRTE